jgi:hypothetical protein
MDEQTVAEGMQMDVYPVPTRFVPLFELYRFARFHRVQIFLVGFDLGSLGKHVPE